MTCATRFGAAVFGAALLAGSPALAKDTDEPVVAGELGAKLDAAVVRAGGDGFWGSVLVAKGGEPVLAKGYGFADFDDTPNTPRTLHELASASKQVTAAAILHLEQEKKLDVTDTLDRFFKKLPADKKRVQVHHLLTHTSGLSPKLGVPYASPIGRKKYVEKMLAEPLVAEPGAVFQYSNVGYALLAAIVEVASGKSFEDYCEKHLFAPAKLADTGFINDADLIRTKRASGRKSPRPGKSTAAEWYWGWGYRGMGGVVTTVLDLLRWDRALRGDGVLGEEAKRKLYTPFKEGYAYGWKVETTGRGTTKVHHSGSVAGYGTNVVRFLEDDVAIFVLSNDGRAAWQVTAAVEKHLFAPVRLEAVVDATPYELGQYRNASLSDKAAWTAAQEDGSLTLRLRDGEHVALEVRVPATYAAKLTSSLERAIAAREADDDGKPAATEAGLYLGPYDKASRRIALDEQLELSIRPEYRGRGADGKPVIDKRVLFVLVDGKHRQWPVMAKMNVAAARSLLAAIAGASK